MNKLHNYKIQSRQINNNTLFHIRNIVIIKSRPETSVIKFGSFRPNFSNNFGSVPLPKRTPHLENFVPEFGPVRTNLVIFGPVRTNSVIFGCLAEFGSWHLK